MGEDGNRIAERLVDDDLLGRVAEVVVAADDVGDQHVDVVGDDGEVVGGGAVGAREDEVVDRVGGEDHLAADRVVEDDVATVLGDLQAPHVRLAGGDARGGIGGRDAAAGAVVAGESATGAGGVALLLELLGAAEARVGVAVRPSATRGARRSARSAASGSTGRATRRPRDPRPSRGRASASRGGSPRCSRRSNARGRCPRCGERRCRHCVGRTPSCRGRSELRRCAGSRWGWVRIARVRCPSRRCSP